MGSSVQYILRYSIETLRLPNLKPRTGVFYFSVHNEEQVRALYNYLLAFGEREEDWLSRGMIPEDLWIRLGEYPFSEEAKDIDIVLNYRINVPSITLLIKTITVDYEPLMYEEPNSETPTIDISPTIEG